MTGDLFGRFPTPADLASPTVNLKLKIAVAMSAAMKALQERGVKDGFNGDRFEVAARMSRMLAPREVTKHMLDAYAAGSKEDHVPNFAFAIAFDAATESNALLDLFAALRGCGVLVGMDNVRAEVLRIEIEEQRLREEKRKLKKHLYRGTR
jgi:hypothetical protein